MEEMENEELDNELDNESGDETDYKSLYETEKAERERASADANKWKDRFKKTKASESSQTKWLDQDSVRRMVDESVWVVKFYSENKNANEYQEDIEALVAKGIERDKAFKYVIAEKDPTLLLDDAKKAQLNGNTALTGVPANLNGQRNPESLSDEEIEQLSDEEFDKLFPSSQNHKKFFSE